MGSGLCGLKDYDAIVTDGKKQSAAQIKATLLKKKISTKVKKANEREGDERECILKRVRGVGVGVGVGKVNYM